ncbi:hypothetical protein [uncultured Porphyromonas sp.]|uniref:hypothetical protein n=1 Tax=uncultured Porphyromonas sp. TaxID=159274 RepID=UPI002596C01D|nr:hypothetical protein [uncultured Porphyromonas sp.]
MKKIIIIAMLFTNLVAMAQEKIGSYTSSFNPDKTEFDVQATQPKKDKFDYYISVLGEKLTDDVNLCLSSKNAEKFVEAMQICKEKFIEWEKTAKDNNVTDMSKEFPVTLPPIDVAWYSSEWWFSWNHVFTPKFFVFKDGGCAFVLYDKVTASSNKYIDKKFYLVLKSQDEFDSLIKNIDKEVVTRHFSEKQDVKDLFK